MSILNICVVVRHKKRPVGGVLGYHLASKVFTTGQFEARCFGPRLRRARGLLYVAWDDGLEQLDGLLVAQFLECEVNDGAHRPGAREAVRVKRYEDRVGGQ